MLRSASGTEETHALVDGGAPAAINGGPIPTAAKINGNYAFAQLGDFNGDGLIDIVERPRTDPDHLHFYIHQGKKADQLKRIVDGIGGQILITYKPISDPSVYQYTSAGKVPPDASGEGFETPPTCRWPLYCHTRGIWVVDSYSISNDVFEPTQGFDLHTFRYAEARTDAERGWLGFAQRIMTDHQTGAIAITNYDNVEKSGTSYPKAFLPAQQIRIVQETSPSGLGHMFVTTNQYETNFPLPVGATLPFSLRLKETTSTESVLTTPVTPSELLNAALDAGLPRLTLG